MGEKIQSLAEKVGGDQAIGWAPAPLPPLPFPQPLWIPAICHSCCLPLTATLIDNEPRAL